MVQTVWRTRLPFWIECQMYIEIAKHGLDSSTNYTSFLTDPLMRCKLQPQLCCAGCTQVRYVCTCAHMTRAAYRPFTAESLRSGRDGCAICSLIYLSLSAVSTHSSHSMLSEAFWTPNTATLPFIELPKPGSQSKSCPIKNKLSSTNFFQVRWTPN